MEISRLREEFNRELETAARREALEEIKIRYLGRKSGVLTGILRGLKTLPPEERRSVGAQANRFRVEVETALAEAEKRLSGPRDDDFDFTMPGPAIATGHLHPLTILSREIAEFFARVGFQQRSGPEVESDYYNFDALNTPADHPARDEHDTFYLAPGILLRSHTSPVQVRTMEKEQPPLRMITIGRCYRRDAVDASHSPVFHQCEGLMVEEGTTFAHLKGILTMFLEHIFPFPLKTRFTPSFFPFTEPSAEMSISCPVCEASGCSSCGRSGFLEVLGCGMVHPNVFRNAGYDPEKTAGFAFGMGLERLAMIKYGITDIRLFLENDRRFLEQFR